MNLNNLFSLQKSLDELITNKHDLTSKNLIRSKILALFTEFGELSNEIKAFKYWSVSKKVDSNKILEEYVDCLHFLLSIGIDKNYTSFEIVPESSDEEELKDTDIIARLLNLYIYMSDFYVTPSFDNYVTLFQDFIYLGLTLEYSIEEIEEAYLTKNNVNIERQRNNY